MVQVVASFHHMRRIDKQDVVDGEFPEQPDLHVLHLVGQDAAMRGVFRVQEGAQPLRIRIDARQVPGNPEPITRVQHGGGGKAGADLNQPLRPQGAQHGVQHQCIAMAKKIIREAIAMRWRRVLGEIAAGHVGGQIGP